MYCRLCFWIVVLMAYVVLTMEGEGDLGFDLVKEKGLREIEGEGDLGFDLDFPLLYFFFFFCFYLDVVVVQ